jgi:hypothetical protein
MEVGGDLSGGNPVFLYAKLLGQSMPRDEIERSIR